MHKRIANETYRRHRHYAKNSSRYETQPPTYFFVGRPHDPPYAWRYDDNLRASNLLWLTEDVLDEEELERLYFEEVDSLVRSEVSVRERERERESEGKGNGKRQKCGSRENDILDLTLSDDDETVQAIKPSTPSKSFKRGRTDGLKGWHRSATRTGLTTKINSSPLARYSSLPAYRSAGPATVSVRSKSKFSTPTPDRTSTRQSRPAAVARQTEMDVARVGVKQELRAVFSIQKRDRTIQYVTGRS